MKRIVDLALVLALGCLASCGKEEPKKTAAEAKNELFRQDAIAEAKRSLGSIEKGAQAAFAKETDKGDGTFVHRICSNSKAKVPAKAPSGRKEAVTKAEWYVEPWICLKFDIEFPQWCQYEFQTNGKEGAAAEYTATATCDPEGGKPFNVTLKGKSNADATDLVRVSLDGPQ